MARALSGVSLKRKNSYSPEPAASKPRARARAATRWRIVRGQAPADGRGGLQPIHAHPVLVHLQVHVAGQFGDGSVVGAARGGGLRFSPHFYQDWSDIERAFAALSQARR